jgi:hypothetical protein
MQSSEQEKAVLVWQSKMIVLFKFYAASQTIALDRECMRELSGAINIKGKVNAYQLAFPRIAKSNMPFIHFWVCSEPSWIAKRYKAI